MLRRLFPHPWGWASLAPLLCAIHCAATPLVVVIAPTMAPGEAIEWALLGLTVLLGATALASGLTRHGDLRPAVPITLGLVVWGASLMHAFHPIPESATTIVASLTVAAGLIWNARIHCAWKAVDGHSCSICEEGAVIQTDPRGSTEDPFPPVSPEPVERPSRVG